MLQIIKMLIGNVFHNTNAIFLEATEAQLLLSLQTIRLQLINLGKEFWWPKGKCLCVCVCVLKKAGPVRLLWSCFLGSHYDVNFPSFPFSLVWNLGVWLTVPVSQLPFSFFLQQRELTRYWCWEYWAWVSHRNLFSLNEEVEEDCLFSLGKIRWAPEIPSWKYYGPFPIKILLHIILIE